MKAEVSEHLSEQHTHRLRKRLLSSEGLLSADDHLAVCEACRQLLREVEQHQVMVVLTSLRGELQTEATAKPDHLRYEQLTAYVDRRLCEVDREIVESHFAICPECWGAVKDLDAFRAEIATYPKKEYAPSKPSSLREKLVSHWRLTVF